MKVKIFKISLVALFLLLFLLSFAWAWDPPDFRNTGHTWDEKNGSTAYRYPSRNFVDGYYIIFNGPYNWVILNLSKSIKKSNSLNETQNISRAQ